MDREVVTLNLKDQVVSAIGSLFGSFFVCFGDFSVGESIGHVEARLFKVI